MDYLEEASKYEQHLAPKGIDKAKDMSTEDMKKSLITKLKLISKANDKSFESEKSVDQLIMSSHLFLENLKRYADKMGFKVPTLPKD